MPGERFLYFDIIGFDQGCKICGREIVAAETVLQNFPVPGAGFPDDQGVAEQFFYRRGSERQIFGAYRNKVLSGEEQMGIVLF